MLTATPRYISSHLHIVLLQNMLMSVRVRTCCACSKLTAAALLVAFISQGLALASQPCGLATARLIFSSISDAAGWVVKHLAADACEHT